MQRQSYKNNQEKPKTTSITDTLQLHHMMCGKVSVCDAFQHVVGKERMRGAASVLGHNRWTHNLGNRAPYNCQLSLAGARSTPRAPR